MSQALSRMSLIVALLLRRKEATAALAEDLSQLIKEQTDQGKTRLEATEVLFGENSGDAFPQLQEVLSRFYSNETEILVKLGVCETVPVANAAEAAAEAAELLTRAGKAH